MSFEGWETAERAVAVIGVGAVLPDAPDASSFWRNVLDARYSITEVPADRWSAEDHWDPDPKVPDKTYSKIGGWVRDFAFDSLKFRIPPKVAAAMDDAQKWGIACTREALADAGHPDRPLDLHQTATILGNAMGGEMHYHTTLRVSAPPTLLRKLLATPAWRNLDDATRSELERAVRASVDHLPPITEDSMPGELANVVAGRIANVFDLHGPNFICDAACASSLAALDAAVEGLVSRAFDVAVCGGVDRNMSAGTFIKFSKIGALSPDGSRPFAKGANGFVMGEGAAVYILKRLADAERAGDRIYAVIRGIGGSSDGRGKGITAPNPEGQRRALVRAYERAGFPISTVGLIEAHGTSTAVGDVAEVASLNEVFRGHGLPQRSVALGSIKSQIGHLKAAAGAAGLLKAILALHHKKLPPSAQFHEPNPAIHFDEGPLYVNTQARPWERPAGGIRRAGVSAFGFGGTNFHVVLEEHIPGLLTTRRPQVQIPGAVGASGSSGQQATEALREPPMLRGLVMVSGATLAEIKPQLERLIAEADAGRLPEKQLPSAQSMRAQERIAIDFGSAKELKDRCQKALEVIDDDRPAAWRLARGKGVFRGREAPGKIAFMFPGQGSQYVNMLRELRDVSATVREVFDEADDVMKSRLDGRLLTQLIFVEDADPKRLEEAEEALRHTTVTQPAMLAADIALARLLGDYGIGPDMVIGHSLGEYAALVAAGVMPFADALVAVSARAREMANVSLADPGKMAGVIGPYEKIEHVLGEVKGYVVAANRNSRKQTVIAGSSAGVDEAIERLRDAGLKVIPLNVSHAFHSEIVAPASEPLRKVIEGLRISPPRLPVIANVDGEPYPSGPDARPGIIDRLARQIAAPVQFTAGLETLYREGVRVFVEVGPKKVLASFAEECLGDREDIVALATNNPKAGPEASFGAALAYLYSIGRGRPRTEPIPDPIPEIRSAPAAEALPASEATIAARPLPPQPKANVGIEPAVRAAAALGNVGPAHLGDTLAPERVAEPSQPVDLATTMELGKLFAEFLDRGIRVYRGAQPAAGNRSAELTFAPVPAPAREPHAAQGSVVVTGAGIGLPGDKLFDDAGFDRILRGDQMIGAIPQPLRERMLDKNVVRLIKSEKASPTLELISDTSDVLKLAGRRGAFNLVAEYGIAEERASAYDITTSMAVAAGLEALRDAGIPLVRRYRRTSTGTFLPDRWMLPEPLADETGVIFASAFPGYNRFAELMGEYHAYKAALSRIEALQRAKEAAGSAAGAIDALIHTERKKLEASPYRFERKFLFEILAMGHSQFAELIGARGPNTQVNAACSSTTLAVAMAEDWIRSGRCARVIVVAADDVTSDTMLEWIGAGFLATGAATTESDVTKAALPFDRRRHGMILGMGACALVVESEDAVRQRGMRGIAEILATETANSAFHGTRLDVNHICEVMDGIVSAAERRHGIDRRQIAGQTVFISHETYTPARGGSASAEVHALRHTFGERASDIVIANTKGFTGHPMGVGIEDALAVKILERRVVPPIPNFKEVDPELGPINLSRGGSYPVEYALRFSAGFGSQVAITLYRRVAGKDDRMADGARYASWLRAMSGYPTASTYVEHRTLRVRDEGVPTELPQGTGWQRGDVPRTRVRENRPATTQPTAPPAGVPRPPSTPARPPSTPPRPPSIPPQAPVKTDDLEQRVLRIVADKTGYPMDMLALDLDLEADLGIDTVKQAEVFAEIRAAFGLPRKDDLRLRDYPTLAHVIGYVRSGLGVPEPAAAQAPLEGKAPAAAAGDDLTDRVLRIVAEKTGYPMDMLALDLDLEADLGIDTVKQAEVFAEIRTTFGLPRKDDLRLRDYPTLGHVIGYVRSGLGLPEGPAAGAAAAAVQAQAAPAPTAPAASAAADDVTAKVLQIVSDKTGYPMDMLALDLDLEADLGIDTVKQAEVFAELRSAFSLPRRDDLRLRDYPTLGHVIGYVRAGRPDLAPAPAPAPTAAADVVAKAATAAMPASDDDVMRIVLEIVSEKTGYPVDMLAPDLDLEADLGVDTVKQAEVFAVVRERFDIPRVTDLKLRDYPTLGHVVGFVKANRKQAAQPPASSEKQPVTAAPGQDHTGSRARRLIPAPMLRPSLDMSAPTGVTVGAGSTVVIVSDQGQAGAQLEALLRDRGARVVQVAGEAAGDDIVTKVRAEADGKPVDGFFFLSSLDAEPPLDEQRAEEFRRRLNTGVRAVYRLARGLYDDLGRKGAFFLAGTRMGGTLGYGSTPSAAPVSGAVSGFTKALAKEREHALVKVVDFDDTAGAAQVAAALLGEVERDAGAIEVAYHDGRRFGVTLLEDTLPAGHRKGPVLGSDSVFVVTGAGGAITSAITADLAQASRGVFHLLDLPPEPDRSNPDLERFYADREGLKRDVMDRLRKSSTERVTPVMVERELQRIEREAVTLAAIRAVEQAGATAHYHRCDVTDTAAVAAVIRSILEQHGRIDVIVHAAGLERSRGLDAKDEKEFNLVFDVKAVGMYNLLAATRGAKVGTIVSFSSVAGRFGNAGQTDYSAANDFLCKTTSALRTLRPDTQGIVIDWTAWGSIGMATRGSIPEIMKRAGIEMLEPAYGIPVVRDEIQRGRRGEVVVAGALGTLVARRDPTGGVEPGARVSVADADGAGPFDLTLVSADPYEGVVLRLELDPREPYLDHHRIDGVPVMPGVMGVEAFAQAVRALLPGARIAAFRDVTFEAPLKCYRDEKRQAELTVRLVDTAHGFRAHCVLSSTWPVASPGKAAEPKRHFAATVVIGEPATLEKRDPPAARAGGGSVEREALYRAYFHGDAFRVLQKTEVGASGRTLVGRLAQPLPPLGRKAYHTMTAPRLLELCFQTAGVVEIGSTRKLGLPSKIDELRVAEGATDGAVALAEVTASRGDDGLSFDTVVCDEAGQVQLVMRGYHTSALPGAMPEEIWQPLRDGLTGYQP